MNVKVSILGIWIEQLSYFTVQHSGFHVIIVWVKLAGRLRLMPAFAKALVVTLAHESTIHLRTVA